MSLSSPTLDVKASPRARPSVLVLQLPARRNARSRLLVVVSLSLILGVFAVRCLPVIRADAITSDETTHLNHIFSLLHNGDDLSMWDLGAPRLPHLLNGLASYAMLKRIGIFTSPYNTSAINELVLSGMTRVLVPARLVSMAWGMLLIGLVFWATARERGAATGLAAALLVSFVPECLAHSSIAGSDMPFTASAFLSLILLARYVEKPTLGRWLVVGLSVGLAWAMRHTALVLVMLAAATHFWTTLRNRKEAGIGPLAEALAASGIAVVAMGVVAFFVLWAGDGFGTVKLAEVAGRSARGLPRTIGPIVSADLPLPTSLVSVIKQVRHQNAGHEAYFLGQFRQTGWPSYFPIAFLLKTPLGLLGLFAITIGRTKLTRPTPWTAIALAFLGLLWIMLLRNKVNIGVRYALLTYPLVMPFVASMFAPRMLRDKLWGPITIAACLWFAVASFAASGRYLSSFNEIGGGSQQGWIYLADSNLDWGQDFDALAETVKRRGIREITTDISTERRLSVPGVYAYYNPCKSLQVQSLTPPSRRLFDSDGGYIPVYTRYVAISASRLLGLYSQNDMSWLRTRKLVERVGDSIFLFDMDLPADRAF
jgi:hypothetical protein